jgi:hypothetical protein
VIRKESRRGDARGRTGFRYGLNEEREKNGEESPVCGLSWLLRIKHLLSQSGRAVKGSKTLAYPLESMELRQKDWGTGD